MRERRVGQLGGKAGVTRERVGSSAGKGGRGNPFPPLSDGRVTTLIRWSNNKWLAEESDNLSTIGW